ncbi:MAG: folate-binding protein [Candidatus Sulfotelmatobacter sp.]
MTLSALQETLNSPRRADYRGATVAAAFADPQVELPVLLSGCGIYDLGFRARISLSGGDRVRWLNGMVTNNIRDLAMGQGIYAFLLNPQGRILGDLHAFTLGESLIVETDRSQVEKILATFDHYIIMDEVEVSNLSDQFTAIGVSGPKSRTVLQAAGVEFPELQPLQSFAAQCDCECGCLECTIIRGEGALRDSYEIWLAPAYVKQLWDALLKAGGTAVGSEAQEMRRILAGVPLYGVDIRERDLPQETEQMRALNFNKGCYVGQEIVERIRSRGSVHRKFTGYASRSGEGQIAPGAKVLIGEKEVGEVTSATTLNTSQDASQGNGKAQSTVALGYIRREYAASRNEVTIAGAKAWVVELPLRETAAPDGEKPAGAKVSTSSTN